MKCVKSKALKILFRRSPHGERGLKFSNSSSNIGRIPSLPARGAWIEMLYHKNGRRMACRSLPARGAWIEIMQS